MTRRRDRQGRLRKKNGSSYVQWTEGNHRPSRNLGRVKDLTKSEARKVAASQAVWQKLKAAGSHEPAAA